jgi:hypothetical protein
MTVPVATPTARFMRVIVKRQADTSLSICWEMSTACRLFFEAGQDFDETSEKGVAADQQKKEYKHRFEQPASERASAAKQPVGKSRSLHCYRHGFGFAPERQTLGLICKFLEGSNRPAQKAEALLQFGNPSGQFLRPIGGRSRQRRPQRAKRAEE